MIIAALALVPVAPYALLGYSINAHDFTFHASTWFDVKNAWLAGQIIPGWAASANYTLGDPHLSLYPPVSLVLGGLLSLVLPLRIAPAVFMWLAFVIAGLAMYVASKPFLAETDRLPAAAIYLLSPYLIATDLVRFSAGEILVQAWAPLILFWFCRIVSRNETRATLLLGCLLGLSWITNVPASIALLYGLFLVATVCACEQRSIGPVLRLIVAEGLAGSLAAFYLLPVWFEQKWVARGALDLWTATREYMLFMPEWSGVPRISKATFFAYGFTGILVIAACLWKRTKTLGEDSSVRTWIYLALTSIVFQLPITLILWKYLPEFRVVQFPFRFLMLTDACLPILLFASATKVSLRKPAYALIAITALLPFLQFGWLKIEYGRGPTMAEVVSGWEREGYWSKPEYALAGTKPAPGPAHLAPASVVNEAPDSNCQIAVQEPWSTNKRFTSDSRSPCQVRLAISYYPYWRAVDETGRSLPTMEDSNGLLDVGVPAGEHIVNVQFHATSTLRTAGILISGLSLFFIAGGLVWPVLRPS